MIAACLNDTSSKDAAAGGGNGGAAIGTGPGSSIHEPTTTVAAREAVYNLREMEYGTLEGATIAGEVTAEIRKISKRWRDGEVDLKVGGVGGESPRATALRAADAVAGLLVHRAGEHVVLVAHSHVNKALLSAVLPTAEPSTIEGGSRDGDNGGEDGGGGGSASSTMPEPEISMVYDNILLFGFLCLFLKVLLKAKTLSLWSEPNFHGANLLSHPPASRFPRCC